VSNLRRVVLARWSFLLVGSAVGLGGAGCIDVPQLAMLAEPNASPAEDDAAAAVDPSDGMVAVPAATSDGAVAAPPSAPPSDDGKGNGKGGDGNGKAKDGGAH
jgi:hypothetical protein